VTRPLRIFLFYANIALTSQNRCLTHFFIFPALTLFFFFFENQDVSAHFLFFVCMFFSFQLLGSMKWEACATISFVILLVSWVASRLVILPWHVIFAITRYGMVESSNPNIEFGCQILLSILYVKSFFIFYFFFLWAICLFFVLQLIKYKNVVYALVLVYVDHSNCLEKSGWK